MKMEINYDSGQPRSQKHLVKWPTEYCFIFSMADQKSIQAGPVGNAWPILAVHNFSFLFGPIKDYRLEQMHRKACIIYSEVEYDKFSINLVNKNFSKIKTLKGVYQKIVKQVSGSLTPLRHAQRSH
jgi:hypothetical protein